MSNDEIKKFIDHSKLYAEVDFEENKKVEEGVLDFITGLFKSKDEAEEVVKKADPEVVKKLDKAVDDNNLDAFGGAGATVVTTQDQANSILQNPNATDAERQAAQEFYGKEKTSSNKGPQVDTDAGANAQANISQNDTSSDASPNIAGNNFATDADGNITRTDDPRQPDEPVTGQDNNPNTDGGQQRDTSQGQDNNPNTDGGQAADPDANDPRGDQTNPPANTQGGATPDTSNAAAMAAGQAGAAAANAPSNGSLLGRKLDLKTPNLMKAYNDGGKKAMPAIKNLQTALSRLGHDPNGLDGKYGKGTYAAVQHSKKQTD